MIHINHTYDIVPYDYESPDWASTGRVHDWKNYISDELAQMWNGFTDQQKKAIARNANKMAGTEEWD